MNKEKIELLSKIMNDKYAVGPFAGMIFNALRDARLKGVNATEEQLIDQALEVRLTMETMSNVKVQKEMQSKMQGQGPTPMQQQGVNDEPSKKEELECIDESLAEEEEEDF